ncbi:hypothetical protein [Pseudomonas sp. C9]|uniref:hypothetical protein n=1 Tax=Pseudomonas sp. C9 TaxID=1311337 RepID=UPI000987102F|nr:hypothetical protein [Pseudomonas sp. C9]OOG11314.1 hypothetical protein BMS17_04145 [Pseudomonas sp. C9]
MTLNRFGAWVWGTGTAVTAILALAVVVYWGGHLVPDGCLLTADKEWKIAGLYQPLKDCGSLVAGILGFSGLAWSHFYAEANKTAEVKKKVAEAQKRAEAQKVATQPQQETS